MFFPTFTSLLAASWALQIAAHGDHAAPSPGRGSVRQRSGRLFPRSYTMQCNRAQSDIDLITTEFSNAAKMAAYAQQNLASSSATTYTDAFIPKGLLGTVMDQLKESYGKANNLPATNPPSPPGDYKLIVTCDNSKSFCAKGYYASMSDSTHTMNLCDAWFDVAGTPATTNLISTSDILAGCKGTSPKYNVLQDIWYGRAQSLLHEWTHTTYFTGTSERTIDYAYGVQNCLNLAAGSRSMPSSRERDTNGNPICPSQDDPTVPGVCDPNFAIDNADTFSIIAGALWYSDAAQCNRAIPIGLTATPPAAKSRKRQNNAPELTLDPPYDGDGFDATSCSDPVNGCCGECSTNPPASSTTSPPSTITAPPTKTPTCTLQDADPDQFINSAGCVCSGTTFPVLSVTPGADLSASCAYTAFPTGTAEASVTHPVSTSNCQVCTLVSNEEANCTPLPASASCTPTSAPPPAASPTTIVQLSNNSVHVGNLYGSSLYTQMWNAVHPLCPDVAAGSTSGTCDSSTAGTIGSIGTVVGEDITEGELTFTVEDSQYASDEQRDALLGAAVRSFQNSAAGKNCGSVTWVEQSGDPCPDNNARRRRRRSSSSRRAARPIDMPPAYDCSGQMQLCNAANLITVELNTPGHPEAAHMNIEVGWQLEGGDSAFLDFLCEVAIEGLDTILLEAAPEVAPEAWTELGSLLPCCEGNCVGSSMRDPPSGARLARRGGVGDGYGAMLS